MVAARIADMQQGGRRRKQPSANLPKVSQPAAARHLNVSTRSVTDGKKVLKKGAPELVASVDSGEMPVSVAATVADLPADEQRKLAKAPAEARAVAAAKRQGKTKQRQAPTTTLTDTTSTTSKSTTQPKVTPQTPLEPATHENAAQQMAAFLVRVVERRAWNKVWDRAYAIAAARLKAEQHEAATERT